MSAELRGRLVALRPIADTDTDNIVRWRNDPAVLHNFIDRRAITPLSHRTWLRTRVATGEVRQFIVTRLDTGADIGSVFLRDVDAANGHCEYGIFLGENSARGRGFGSEACVLALRYAFGELGMHRVFLRAFADNEQALRSYEKAGFRREGLLRGHVLRDGVYCDLAILGILKEEFDQ